MDRVQILLPPGVVVEARAGPQIPVHTQQRAHSPAVTPPLSSPSALSSLPAPAAAAVTARVKREPVPLLGLDEKPVTESPPPEQRTELAEVVDLDTWWHADEVMQEEGEGARTQGSTLPSSSSSSSPSRSEAQFTPWTSSKKRKAFVELLKEE